MRSKISVCLATYNGEKFILSQLVSILEQLQDDDEVIVSDDHSDDSTIALIKSLNDHRVRIVFNDRRKRGYTKNFENALRHVSGEIIFLSDQDDIWMPDKVEKSLELLKCNDLIVTDCLLINENGDVMADSFFKIRRPALSLLGNFVKFGYLGCCLAFKRPVLRKALPFPSNSRLCTHDNWLFLVGAFFFRYNVSNERLIMYRRHQENTSVVLKSKTSLYFKFKYRFYIIGCILKRLF